MGRKTFSVEKFVDECNNILATSTQSPEYRQGIMTAVETVLHESGQYNGFRYLAKDEVTFGYLPGCRYGEHRDYWFEDTDNTRVQYGVKKR